MGIHKEQMAEGTRRKNSGKFSAKVALAAIAGKTLAELAQQFENTSNPITGWKRQLSESLLGN